MQDKDVYDAAREQYAAAGVDTEKAIEFLQNIPVSLHCWQGDDVGGFEKAGATLDGGGIQVTGNYPGKARTIARTEKDIEKVLTLTPGTYRLNACKLCGLPVVTGDRDKIERSNFDKWIDWAMGQNLPLDSIRPFFPIAKQER